MKSILVTGASGFVGSHFIKQFADKYQILAIWRSATIVGQNVMSLQLDLGDKSAVLKLLEKTRPDVILHLAGMSKTWDTPLEVFLHHNLELTQNLLESVAELKEQVGYDPKIIVVSSAEVYGLTTNPKSIDENSPFYPLGEYGLSKVFVDRLAYFFAKRKGLNVVIMRSFNHIGPGQKLGFFVSDMASQIAKIEAKEQDTLTVGNLTSIRDTLDVRDVIRAYEGAVEANLPRGEAYNICSGKGISMKQLLDKLTKLSSTSIKVVEDPERMRAGDNPISVGNNKKFRSAVKWKPEIDLELTLKDCLNYWREKES